MNLHGLTSIVVLSGTERVTDVHLQWGTIMVAAVKPVKKQNVSQSVPLLISLDVGNHQTEAYFSVDGEMVSSTCASWIQSCVGSPTDSSHAADNLGSSIEYRAGSLLEDYNAIYKVGESADKTRLVGDDPDNKQTFYLPFLLHFLRLAKPEEKHLNVVAMLSLDDMSRAAELKARVSGTHGVDFLHTDSCGTITRSSLTVNIVSFITQEGIGTERHLHSISAIEQDEQIAIADFGGNTLDVLSIRESSIRRSASLALGGNDVINELLERIDIRQRFRQANLNLNRSAIAAAIKDGSFTCTSGDGRSKVCFSDEAHLIVMEFLPRWIAVIKKVVDATHGDTVALTGGQSLMQYKGDISADDDGLVEGWSLVDLLRSRLSYHILSFPDAASLNAKGGLLMLLQLEDSGKLPEVTVQSTTPKSHGKAKPKHPVKST